MQEEQKWFKQFAQAIGFKKICGFPKKWFINIYRSEKIILFGYPLIMTYWAFHYINLLLHFILIK